MNSKNEDSQLERIEQVIQEIGFNWATSFPKILDHDKLLEKNTFARLYVVNENGKVRFTRGYELVLPKDCERKWSYWQKKFYKSMAIFYWLALPNTPQQAGELMEKKYKDTYKMASPDYQWSDNVPEHRLPFYYFYYGFSWLFWEPYEFIYHQVHDAYLQCLASRYSSRIIIALRRYKNEHNQWPESLEDIKEQANEHLFIDPINGADYVYKLTDDNFTLYSKGKNNIDEDGDRGTKKPDETRTDDMLYWPRK